MQQPIGHTLIEDCDGWFRTIVGTYLFGMVQLVCLVSLLTLASDFIGFMSNNANGYIDVWLLITVALFASHGERKKKSPKKVRTDMKEMNKAELLDALEETLSLCASRFN